MAGSLDTVCDFWSGLDLVQSELLLRPSFLVAAGTLAPTMMSGVVRTLALAPILATVRTLAWAPTMLGTLAPVLMFAVRTLAPTSVMVGTLALVLGFARLRILTLMLI